MGIDFVSSPRASLGIEVEVALIDPVTGGLVSRSTEVLDALARRHGAEEHPRIKRELYQSTVEVITGVCQTVREAHADLTASMVELDEVTSALGVGFAGMGLHPFTSWTDLSLSPVERYQRLVDSIGLPARQLTTQGVHVHVGVRSGERAVHTVNALTGPLPVILALSASSPHWNGLDTGLASMRTKVFEMMPTTGLPPYLASWDDFNALLDSLIEARTIQTVREVWWDIRPHPSFGTVELRMADSMPTVWETCAIAALAQCLVQSYDDTMEAGGLPPVPREWVRRENKWRAARFGLDAELVMDDTGRTSPLREVASNLVDELMPVAQRLDCVDELSDVRRILAEGASYERQRAIVRDGATYADVVAQLREEMAQELASGGAGGGTPTA